MKTKRTLIVGSVAIAAFGLNANARADNLAAAAAKASALVNRPIAASPHGLEEFPELLRGYSPPAEVKHPATNTTTYPNNLAAAAAQASALVNRPIAASPHALEEFPWLLRGYRPQTKVRHQVKNNGTDPDNLAGAAAKVPAEVNRPIVPSTHRGDYP